MSAVNVLAALGANRLETSGVASRCGVSNAVALRALRRAEAGGLVESVNTAKDGTYWRRGAARPLIWRALARCKGEPA